MRIVPQAGVDSSSSEPDTSKLVDFELQEGGFATKIDSQRDDTFDLAFNADASLGEFLKRPVKLGTYTWDGFTGVSERIDLLRAFVSDKHVVNRINNHTYMSGTMCVRLVTNGTPYHYGKLIASVNYWPGQDDSFTAQPNVNQCHQLPHVCVDPTRGSAGCLSIPLLHPWNASNILDPDPVVNLEIKTINPLRVTGANPTSPPSIDVVVWAWMSDFKLHAPTSRSTSVLVPQAATEYQVDSISTGATILAGTAAKFSNLPYIGRYARISSLAMNMVATVASLLGFSRPANLENEMRIAHRPISNLSNINVKDNCTKLALDCKQEVTIDPMVTGAAMKDEMMLHEIAQKEGYLTTFDIDSTTLYGPRVIVSPFVNTTSANADGDLVYDFMPMGYISVPFEYWRGTLKFRFEVVASAFHRGKIRFVYDANQPSDDTWNIYTNVNHSKVMDLANEREFTMEVGWASNRPFLNLGSVPFTGVSASNIANGDYNTAHHNGTISVYMEQPLRSIESDSNPTAFINIYACSGSDFQLCAPTANRIDLFSNNYLEYVPNGAIEETPGVGQIPDSDMSRTVLINDEGSVDYDVNDKLCAICFGERVLSIRQMIKRYCCTSTYTFVTTSNKYTSISYNFNDFPQYGGHSQTGTDGNTFNGRVNFSSYSNYLNWYTPMFLMRRGGIRNRYMYFAQGGSYGGVSVLTGTRSANDGFIIDIRDSDTTDQLHNRWFIGIIAKPTLMAGGAVSIPTLNPTLEIETPYQTNKRFFFAQRRDKETNHTSADISQETGHEVKLLTSKDEINGYLQRYTAAADDFSLHVYKYTPLVLRYPIADPSSQN